MIIIMTLIISIIIIATELDDKNLIKAIKTKTISVEAYPINICEFPKEELNELVFVLK